jgi:CBS domain-containing protein
MPIIDHKSVLRDIKVQEAMRRLVIRSAYHAPIEHAARLMIKYKVNAILVANEEEDGIGVVSKTDLMGAYYAELPIESPVEAVMIGPPLFCHVDDSLDSALEAMRSRSVHRLYVLGDMPGKAVGVLAYPDIAGMLYRYCYRCDRSITRRRGERLDVPPADRIAVHEVMTDSVHSNLEYESLVQVMEGLASHHLGAALIVSGDGLAAGVISKTDLILAYKHGTPSTAEARSIMQSPVISCSFDDPLAVAIQKMIFHDVHRLFVHKGKSENICGVVSLTDAARVRSGSCRACIATRVQIGNAPAV